MDTRDINDPNQELHQVIDLFTPKFPRKCEFSFTKTRKPSRGKIWAISGIAAMLAIILTVSIKSTIPVSAKEVVTTALVNLSRAESVRIDFLMRSDGSDTLTEGTLYILHKGDKIFNRMDWNDKGKHSMIYNGANYIHLKNGIKVNGHPSKFYYELMNLIISDSLRNHPEDLTANMDATIRGNIITVTKHKDVFTLRGEFHKGDKKLVKASATASAPDGRELTIFETKSIETDVRIPDSAFSE